MYTNTSRSPQSIAHIYSYTKIDTTRELKHVGMLARMLLLTVLGSETKLFSLTQKRGI
jgi:hypothetical protein